jgi:hypothetical protein
MERVRRQIHTSMINFFNFSSVTILIERRTHDQIIVGSNLGQGISVFFLTQNVRVQVAPSMLAS